ncbi:MAG TPA: 5'-nucleotidase C-terminal domain-containing protein [Gemmatimonadales bacterium]|nr:5'-nucleotidase C-terminal domain-containing protein [Gemmatimonadales bacterium]
MPNRRAALRGAALSVALAASLAFPLSAQDTAHVVIVATTDVHGHATGWDFVDGRPFPGGLTRVGSVVDSLRRRYPGQVVLVDAGDLIEGDPFAAYFATVAPQDPDPMVDALNGLAYDAAVPGNHEFNFGVPFFERAMSGARYAVVAANIVAASGKPPFPPYTVVQRGGVKVAIGGLTTPGSMVWDREHLRGQVRIDPIASSAPALLGELRAEGDVAVVLVHSGMDGESSYDTTGVGPENAAASLASGDVRPDVVVVGHTHREMVDSVINGVHFVQPRVYAQSVAVVHLSLARRGGHWAVTAIHADRVPLDREPESSALVRRLAPARSAVTGWISQPIGYAVGPFPAQGARASATPLMGLVGEAERRAAHADLAAVSAFSTSGGLPAGEIHRSDIFSVYPYENTLGAVRISGAQLRAYLEQAARYFRVGPGGRVTLNDSVPGYNYDMVWGADYLIDLSKPEGQRITSLSVKGRPVAPTDSFTLAVNSYRLSGGGGYTMLAGAPVTYDRGGSVRDLLEAAVGRDTLHPRDYARENWRIVPDRAAEEVRALFGLKPLARAPVPTDTVELRILALGALHGQLDPDGANGGVAALKTVLDSVAARCDCPVLKVAAGELLQGTRASDLVHGQSMVEALDRLGLDATAVGVGDLAWSADTLERRMSGSRFAWVTANYLDPATRQRPDWAIPYRVLAIGKRKVAVVGFTAGQDSLAPGLAALRDAAGRARAERPDLLVLLASGEAAAIAQGLPPATFDAIVSASGPDTTVNGTPILAGASRGVAVSRVDLVRTVVGGRIVRRGVDTVRADRVRADSGEVALLARYGGAVDSAASRVVATAKLPLLRSPAQSPLGNLVVDAWRNALRTDIAILADSELHSDLPAGPLTYGTLRDLVGAYGTLERRTWTGAGLRQFLEEALAGDGPPSFHVSGLTITYDPKGRPGRRVKDIRLVDGSKLRDRTRYWVAASAAVPAVPGQVVAPDDAPVRALHAVITYFSALPQPIEAPERPRFVAAR